jgi:hypothetical protein
MGRHLNGKEREGKLDTTKDKKVRLLESTLIAAITEFEKPTKKAKPKK